MTDPGKQASIYQIAAAARVSVGTVSNVINHPERVSTEVRQRVEAVMSDLRFRPHPAARALSRAPTRMLGAVVFDIANPFFSEVTHRLDRLARQSDNALMVAGSEQSAEAERQVLDAMLRAGVTGLAVCSTGQCYDSLAALQQRGIPVLVYAQRSLDPRIEHVTIDDVEGMRLIATHLLGRGVDRFCFLQEPGHAIQHQDRWRGFVAGLDAAGYDRERVELAETTGPTWAGGFTVAAEVLSGPRSGWPECFVCLNDYTAMGVCRAVREAGLEVGGDILVTGYDDIPYAAVLDAPLTTIRQPIAELSQHLVTQLLGAIDRRDPTVEGRVFAPRIVIRRSA